MNAVHYLVGYAHYACVALAFVSESPGFTPGLVEVHGDHLPGGIRWVRPRPEWRNLLTAAHAALVAAFACASAVQHGAFRTLARLRRKEGSCYVLPRGGCFELVSCPHYGAEVAVYACLSGILGWRHRSGLLVLLWVAVNQTVAALMSHFWYQDNFPNYPKSRKALLPFLL